MNTKYLSSLLNLDINSSQRASILRSRKPPTRSMSNFKHLSILLSMTATVHAVSTDTAPQNESTGWCSSADGRGTLDIVRSCLFTVFTCCWTASHPDIAHPGSSWTYRAMDRIACLLVAAIAPEILVFIALCEWAAARDVLHRRNASEIPRDWSVAHYYYANMGGYCMLWKDKADGLVKLGFLDSEQVPRLLYQNELCDTTHLSREAIEDKGKADWFVKDLALLQVTWLITQCVARVIQKLPLTTFELSTPAYIPCALLVFYLWWDKPYDIRQPTMVFFKDHNRQPTMKMAGLSIPLAYVSDSVSPIETVIRSYQNFPMTRTCIDSVYICFFRVRSVSTLTLSVGLFYAIFGGIHCAAWNFPFPTDAERLPWRACSIIMSVSIPASWLLTRLVMICLQGGVSDILRYGTDEKARVQVKVWPLSSPGISPYQALNRFRS